MGNFKIGEKVVCINDSKQIHNVLKKGEIYKVRGFCIHNGDLGILLEDIFLDILSNGVERGHKIKRFRKLDYEFAENLLAEISEAMKSETIKN